MTRFILSRRKYFAPSFGDVRKPLTKVLLETPILESRGNRPLRGYQEFLATIKQKPFSPWIRSETGFFSKLANSRWNWIG